jgi:NAD(P)-dependent dehydrogenase (short-subunit alcohol dehydrogenase family)
MDIAGKVALSIEVSQGIGKAIAERLSSDSISAVNYFLNRPVTAQGARADEVVQTIDQNGGVAVAAEVNQIQVVCSRVSRSQPHRFPRLFDASALVAILSTQNILGLFGRCLQRPGFPVPSSIVER